MRTAKEFLEQECLNLRAVLEETLRFKYGLSGSQQFFDECQQRLTFISDTISRSSPTDYSLLQKSAVALVELSALVSRIERSSIGEYSWPFVEELKRIASAICTEETVTDSNRPPMVHVLSDGGLDKYAIFTEANRPSHAGKRILTIVFPRSLKHFVLLHSILGHEIGHAMWQCSKHQLALRTIFNTHLFSSGVFVSENETAAWLYSSAAPTSVKARLADLQKAVGLQSATFFKWASWNAWREEIICDLIGLLTFGPSFVGAECNLLHSFYPEGDNIGQRHPPVGCRTNYLLHGSEVRGYDSDQFADESLKTAVQRCWADFRARKQADPWFNVFTEQQIRATTDAIAQLLETLPPARYVQPSEADLKHLVEQLNRSVPPVGFNIATDRSIDCRKIDFRHTLYAGWIKTASLNDLTFEQINRLCGHGIMQQRGIDIELD